MPQLRLMMWNIKQVSLKAMTQHTDADSVLNERVAWIIEAIMSQEVSIAGIVEIRPGDQTEGEPDGRMIPLHIAEQLSVLTNRPWRGDLCEQVCKGSYKELNGFVYDSSVVTPIAADVLNDSGSPFVERRPYLAVFEEKVSKKQIPFCIIHFPAPERVAAIQSTSKSLAESLKNVQLMYNRFVLAGDFNVNYASDPTFFDNLGTTLGNVVPLVTEKSTVGKSSKTTPTHEKSAYDNAYVYGIDAMGWIYNYVLHMKHDTGLQKGYVDYDRFEKSMLGVSDHLPLIIHLEW